MDLRACPALRISSRPFEPDPDSTGVGTEAGFRGLVPFPNQTRDMQKKLILILPALLNSLTATATPDPWVELPPFEVRGSLLQPVTGQLPFAASILGRETLESVHLGHLEDAWSQVPNLTHAGGTHRLRFIQIRGIGEVSQFGNEIPASSVGVNLDGMDFTGMASVLSLWDIQQIEVIRGPQSTAQGASALGGMVILESQTPPTVKEARLSAEFGNYGLRRLAVAAGGPVLLKKATQAESNTALLLRIAAEQRRSDGYFENTYLDRSDTHRRDESTVRLRMRADPTQRLRLDISALYADFDNGYDAWSLTDPDFTTTTDEPGVDRQKAMGASLRANLQLPQGMQLRSTTAFTQVDSRYSFDWDWSNPEELRSLYGPEIYFGTDTTDRERTVFNQDVRLESSQSVDTPFNWSIGFHHRNFQEDQTYFDVFSTYQTMASAAYAAMRYRSGNFAIEVAGRLEDFEIEFTREAMNPSSTEETLWGGALIVHWNPQPDHHAYLSLSRGFKAGGINLDTDVPETARSYNSESLINLELGWNASFLEDRLQSKWTFFHMFREGIHVDASVQTGDGNTFALFKDNAAEGTNSGLEWEWTYLPSRQWRFRMGLGLLKAKFEEYRYRDPARPDSFLDFSDKDQPYAPEFTFTLSTRYRHPSGLFAETTLYAVDTRTFDLPSGSTLDGYTQVNAALGYQNENWRVSLWIRNAFDENRAQHGFYFANEPPYYDKPRAWISPADPQTFGVSIDWKY